MLSILLGILGMIGENRERILYAFDTTIKPGLERVDPFFLVRTTYQSFTALMTQQALQQLRDGGGPSGLGTLIADFFQALGDAVTQMVAQVGHAGWPALVPGALALLIGVAVASDNELPLWHPVLIIFVLLVAGGVTWTLQHIFLGAIYYIDKPLGALGAWLAAVNGTKWAVDVLKIRLEAKEIIRA